MARALPRQNPVCSLRLQSVLCAKARPPTHSSALLFGGFWWFWSVAFWRMSETEGRFWKRCLWRAPEPPLRWAPHAEQRSGLRAHRTRGRGAGACAPSPWGRPALGPRSPSTVPRLRCRPPSRTLPAQPRGPGQSSRSLPPPRCAGGYSCALSTPRAHFAALPAAAGGFLASCKVAPLNQRYLTQHRVPGSAGGHHSVSSAAPALSPSIHPKPLLPQGQQLWFYNNR